MLKFKQLEDYLKRHINIDDARRYLRLPSKIPVLYAFSDKEKKKDMEFRQCHTTNISQGGLAIEVIDAPILIQKKLLRFNKDIFLKIDIPKKEQLIEFTGKIQWYDILQKQMPNRYLIGIKFNNINPDNKIDILSYSLKLIRKKKIARFVVISLCLCVILTGVWAIRANLSKKEVKEKLIVSEDAQRKLRKEVAKLIYRREELERELKKNNNKIIRQNKLLKQLKKIIGERSLYLNNSKLLLQDIYKEWNIDSASSFIVFDKLYQDGRKALKEKEYNKAIKLLKELITKYPDSLLGYRILINAYHQSGQIDQENKVFEEYTKKLKKQIISRSIENDYK